jgi:hypothetical protein
LRTAPSVIASEAKQSIPPRSNARQSGSGGVDRFASLAMTGAGSLDGGACDANSRQRDATSCNCGCGATIGAGRP